MFSLLLVLAASISQQMAPASQGKLQCLSPIESMKTCDSLSRITQVAPGQYRYEAQILLDADGPVVATEHGTLAVQGSKICEKVRLSNLDTMTFKVAGAPASAAETARYRTDFKRKFAVIAGQMICNTIAPEEDGLHEVETFIAGRRVSGLDYSMKWVDPGDGWKVAP
jgi:hypothetical protein